MMNQFRCLSCQGTYFDSSADGTLYFHVCPPWGYPDVNGIETALTSVRNENVTRLRPGAPLTIVSEGAGVECLSDPRLTEPPFITKLKVAQAKEEANDNS